MVGLLIFKEVIGQAEFVVGAALERPFTTNAEAGKEFHEIRITVGNAKSCK